MRRLNGNGKGKGEMVAVGPLPAFAKRRGTA